MNATDLIHTTNDIRTRCERVVAALTPIARGIETPFADPRTVYVDLILAGHELDAATRAMCRA
jgi:hypothetical protein